MKIPLKPLWPGNGCPFRWDLHDGRRDLHVLSGLSEKMEEKAPPWIVWMYWNPRRAGSIYKETCQVSKKH
jgi:hypothetical protein